MQWKGCLNTITDCINQSKRCRNPIALDSTKLKESINAEFATATGIERCRYSTANEVTKRTRISWVIAEIA